MGGLGGGAVRTMSSLSINFTTQNMKFSITDFFSTCNQIRMKLSMDVKRSIKICGTNVW